MDEPPPQPTFTVDGNRLTMLDTGPRRYRALLDLIEGAQHSLRMLYYIYEDDAAGHAVGEALAAAAARGVKVSLLVDGLGSEAAAGRDFFEGLTAGGVDVCRFIPRFGRRYLLRNHQKLALADEARVIIGGFNIKSDYFGAPGDDHEAWRDLGLLVEGPAAARLAGYFDALLRWAQRPKAPIRALNRLLRVWSEDEGPVRWLLGGPTRRLSPWARVIQRELKRGRHIDLIAAYFAPGPLLLRRLGRAARGGTVRIVLPARTDNYMAIWASRFTYAGLLRRGVAIHEYQATKLHTKLIAIDDAVHIGSANFDIRSLFVNMELMLRIDDPAFARHVHAYVDGEVAQSELITPALHRERMSIPRRISQAAAYFLMAVVDPSLSRTLPFWGEKE
ncbi:phospholipase D-like domain-containing protein [Sphingomonas qomolangmaensis]|uniref:Phospholipase D n=1 Tax=Sphingomonas qomolangmaensis TaxID=2918765 RepID=A0ABY5L5L4_9SPHN|nr:phospholipase D-like domain-containing protein [Sphingomonas qomolangmaensis]UUL82240.1 phospholipase D-like domain-containing protein [Sphingomonas qomolangmaensis]